MQRATCAACERSMNEACARQPVPVALCGLCALMEPEALDRYFRRWNPTVAGLAIERDRDGAAA